VERHGVESTRRGPSPSGAEVRLPAALALYPADLATVQKLAGHSDPATTARYHRCGERAMREAASHLHVPHCFGDEHSEKEGSAPFGRLAEALRSQPRVGNIA
jgi:hypothetical protein